MEECHCVVPTSLKFALFTQCFVLDGVFDSSSWLQAHYVDKDDFELLILLSPPSECCDERYVCTTMPDFYIVLVIQLRALCMLAKNSTSQSVKHQIFI